MADRSRPGSGASGKKSRSASASSGKKSRPQSSLGTATSQITVKALKELKLDDTVQQNGVHDSVDDMNSVTNGDVSRLPSGSRNSRANSNMGNMPEQSNSQALIERMSQDLDIEDDVDEEEDIEDSGMDMARDSDEAEEDDPDSNMIVLDPDHPLMKRFQRVYKEHLSKQDEKVTLELRELNEEHGHIKKQREEIGVELYGVQQELARQQMLLEKGHDQFNEQHQLRNQWESRLQEIRAMYKTVVSDVHQQRKKTSDIQTEVENIATQVLYIQNAKEDIRSDIAILKRGAEKAESEISKAQQQKKQQDLLVNKLTTAVDHLREDISMYKAQIEAQRDETKSATKILTEASTELESIELEKKQLLQQWNNSLIGMKRRDEAYTAIQQAVSLQNQLIMAIETELDGYKRQIQKAQEQNEQLTYMHNRIESDISSVKKQIQICLNKQEALKIEYNTYSRALHETEQLLNKATIEVTLKEAEIVNLRKQIEREFFEKVKLEDDIMHKMQEQLTSDKASQFSKKMSDKIRRRATELERNVAEVENNMAQDLLEIANGTTKIAGLEDTFGSINQTINSKNDTINKIENEILKGNAVVEKKQGQIDQFNKRIETLLTKEGDEMYVGPLEFQIKNLQKAIEAKTNECLDLQQYWLRQQGDLVRVIREVGEQSTEVESKKKQSTILLQKKLRVEGEIESQINEIKDIERSIRAMQNDMTKLNLLIHKNRDMQNNLQQDNILLENDFIATLKDAELESIQIQNNIESLQEEKERLLNALVEAERQMMLWEKKTQLAREARDAVDSETGQGEIRAMKAEIHRMEVRYAQLMRQQEKMMQDMEKSVFKRECIIVRGDAQAKVDRKKLGKEKLSKGTFHKKLVELKKKVKNTALEADSCDEEIRHLREQQLQLGGLLEERQQNGFTLQQAIDDKDADLDRMAEVKQKNLNDIVSKQQRVKHMTSVKGGKYTRICKTPSSLDTETQKQNNRLMTVQTIVDRLNSEYPEIQTAMRQVTLSLGDHGLVTERTDRSITSGRSSRDIDVA